MSNKLYCIDIANYLNSELIGDNLLLNDIVGIPNLKSNSLSFINKKNYQEDIQTGALVIVIEGYNIDEKSHNSYIVSKTPRLDFIKVFNKFFKPEEEIKISNTVKIGKNCNISKNVSIGEYCVIKDNVYIGSGTVLNSHIVIEKNTVVGNNCYIKSGAIIGEDGFGFEQDENGTPLRFPHIGNVTIGDNVEIGANTVIARGTFDSTTIQKNVKIDDHVFIAHNVIVGENTIITASVEISGSVKIGKNCWIGPNATIRDGVVLGNDVFLGMASVVSKNIKEKTKLAALSNLSYRDIVIIGKLSKK